MQRNALNKQIGEKRKVGAASHPAKSSNMLIVMLDITLNDSMLPACLPQLCSC